MALFQPYKGTGSPPSIIEDGNIYFNLTDKTILVDHNDQRYTFEGTDTNTNLVTSVNNKTGAVNLTTSDVGAAASDHTHNSLEMAPSNKISSSGSAQTEDSGPFNVRWYSETGKIAEQPSQYGFLLTCATAKNSAEQHALWLSQCDGDILHRGTNGANNTSPPAFKTLLDSANWSRYCAAASHSHTLASLGAAASSHNHDAGNITSGRLGRDRMPYWTNEVIWTSASHSTTYAASGYATFTTSAGASNAIYAVVTCILDATNSSLGYVDLIFPRQNQTNGYAWFGDDNYASGRWYGVYNGAYYSRKFGRLALNEGGGYGDMNLWSNGYKNTTGGNQYLCPVRISIVY